MGYTRNSRRGVLLTLSTLVVGATLPVVGGVGGGRSTESEGTPTVSGAASTGDGEYVVKDGTTGWGIGAASGQGIDTEQAARFQRDLATASTDAQPDTAGGFTQIAVIGAPFTVSTEQPVDLTVDIEGGYRGALRAGPESSVTGSMVYGVGPATDVRGAALGVGQPPTFEKSTIRERTLFDQEVIDGRATVRDSSVTATRSVRVEKTTEYVAYAKLTFSGEVGAGDTATVDFSPDGPTLIETSADQRDKGFCFDRARLRLQ